MKLAPFIAEVPAEEGGKIIIGGLCASDAVRTVLECCGGMKPLRLPDGDISVIDQALAALLDTLDRADVLVAGASAVVPRLAERLAASPWRTGGVIGVPGSPPEAAGEALELLDSGLYLFAAPGGPGFAAAASAGDARRLAALAKTGASASALLAALRSLAPEGYLLVCDGMGSGTQGLLAAGAAGEALLKT